MDEVHTIQIRFDATDFGPVNKEIGSALSQQLAPMARTNSRASMTNTALQSTVIARSLRGLTESIAIGRGGRVKYLQQRVNTLQGRVKVAELTYSRSPVISSLTDRRLRLTQEAKLNPNRLSSEAMKEAEAFLRKSNKLNERLKPVPLGSAKMPSAAEAFFKVSLLRSKQAAEGEMTSDAQMRTAAIKPKLERLESNKEFKNNNELMEQNAKMKALHRQHQGK